MNSPTEHTSKTLESAREYFDGDLFATEATGIVIDEVGPSSSVCSIDVEPRHLNVKGGVMGGVFYTMADFAASVADWYPGRIASTVDSSMQFLHLAKGSHITATATAERNGRALGFYHVKIVDEMDTDIAIGTYTIYHIV